MFFRIDPVTAVWADHRVRLLWRVFLEFDALGTQITTMRPYDTAVGRRPVASCTGHAAGSGRGGASG